MVRWEELQIEANNNLSDAALRWCAPRVARAHILMSEDIVGLLRDASVGLLRVGLLRAALRKS